MASERTQFRLAMETQEARNLLASVKEIIGDDEQAAADAVEGETSFMEAVDAAIGRMDELGNLIDAIDRQKQMLSARQKRFDDQIVRMRQLVLTSMTTLEFSKLERPAATISKVKPKQKLEVSDEADVPSQYFTEVVSIKLDRNKLTAALRALADGEEIPGASLVLGPETLSIRKV
jgi:small-conductance mechanosensitive channel